jgi:hypothetical protein
MDIEKFWSVIEDAHQASNGNLDKQLELLVELLSQLPAESIQEFDRLLWMIMARSYRADLWEAASVVACGCTDDGFHEFQGWLIAQGETIYEKVLDDPNNLANVVSKEQRFNIFNGRMTSIAQESYERKAGQDIPETGYRETVKLTRHLLPANERPTHYPLILAALGKC